MSLSPLFPSFSYPSPKTVFTAASVFYQGLDVLRFFCQQREFAEEVEQQRWELFQKKVHTFVVTLVLATALQHSYLEDRPFFKSLKQLAALALLFFSIFSKRGDLPPRQIEAEKILELPKSTDENFIKLFEKRLEQWPCLSSAKPNPEISQLLSTFSNDDFSSLKLALWEFFNAAFPTSFPSNFVPTFEKLCSDSDSLPLKDFYEFFMKTSLLFQGLYSHREECSQQLSIMASVMVHLLCSITPNKHPFALFLLYQLKEEGLKGLEVYKSSESGGKALQRILSQQPSLSEHIEDFHRRFRQEKEDSKALKKLAKNTSEAIQASPVGSKNWPSDFQYLLENWTPKLIEKDIKGVHFVHFEGDKKQQGFCGCREAELLCREKKIPYRLDYLLEGKGEKEAFKQVQKALLHAIHNQLSYHKKKAESTDDFSWVCNALKLAFVETQEEIKLHYTLQTFFNKGSISCPETSFTGVLQIHKHLFLINLGKGKAVAIGREQSDSSPWAFSVTPDESPNSFPGEKRVLGACFEKGVYSRPKITYLPIEPGYFSFSAHQVQLVLGNENFWKAFSPMDLAGNFYRYLQDDHSYKRILMAAIRRKNNSKDSLMLLTRPWFKSL